MINTQKPVIWVDSREKANKHICDALNNQKIKWFVSKLPIGDYMSLDNARLIIERKNSIAELANSLSKEHERFKNELAQATRFGIHIIILIEEDGYFSLDDIKAWVNKYKSKNPRAMSGETIYKILSRYCEYYNIEIQFTSKGDCAQTILKLLKVV